MSFKIHSSALARIMKCAGYVKFKDLPAYVQGESAAEGEAAGEFLTCLVETKSLPVFGSSTALMASSTLCSEKVMMKWGVRD